MVHAFKTQRSRPPDRTAGFVAVDPADLRELAGRLYDDHSGSARQIVDAAGVVK